jgi:hypothetical protein
MSLFGASAITFLQGISLFLMLAALIPIAFAVRRLGFLCSMRPVIASEAKQSSRKDANEKS